MTATVIDISEIASAARRPAGTYEDQPAWRVLCQDLETGESRQIHIVAGDLIEAAKGVARVHRGARVIGVERAGLFPDPL